MSVTLPAGERERRLKAWREGRDKGLSKAAIARALGLKPSTFVKWSEEYGDGQEVGISPEMDPLPGAVPPEPIEKHDAAFWRRKAREHEREVERLHRIAEELAGVRQVPVEIPDWLAPGEGKRHRSALLFHNSDWHMGETIRPGEVQGVNEFNPDICAARLERFTQAACEMGTRWQSDCEPRGVVMTLCGDLISGDIHEELARTNALTSHEQVRAAAEVACGMIATLAEAFGRVHVVGVPGNHARTTKKPTAKLYGALSYDILICAMVADRLRDDGRITWQIDGATDQIVPLFGWHIMVTHGDKLGTGGGMGFAGPVLPMMRGVHKTRAQQAAIGAQPDLILAGHFHTSAALPGALFNGSVPGWSEYGRDIRGGVEPPKQWLALMTARWGLRERCDVQLEEPARAKVTVQGIAA